MGLNESHVEDAALEWCGDLGYEVGHGQQFAPGESAAERESFSEVVLVGRFRESIRRLNPANAWATLTPALCLRPSPLRSGSQKGEEARATIRRLNPANACGSTGGFRFQREGRRCHEEQTGA